MTPKAAVKSGWHSKQHLLSRNLYHQYDFSARQSIIRTKSTEEATSGECMRGVFDRRIEVATRFDEWLRGTEFHRARGSTILYQRFLDTLNAGYVGLTPYLIESTRCQEVPSVEFVLLDVSFDFCNVSNTVDSHLQLVISCTKSLLAYFQKLFIVNVSVLDDLRGRLRQCRGRKCGGW